MFFNLSNVQFNVMNLKGSLQNVWTSMNQILNTNSKLFHNFFNSLQLFKYYVNNQFQPRLGILSLISFQVPGYQPLTMNRYNQPLCAQTQNLYYTFKNENQPFEVLLKLVLTFR